jgi:LysR family transcriptional regulator for bpeEF and oprC
MQTLSSGPPRGVLRILSSSGFGRKIVAPLLSDFLVRHPEIALELVLSDRPTGFTADQIDVSFREGHVESGAIVVARRLMPMQMIVCASRAYARRHGLPSHVDDLADHRCLNFRSVSGSIREWEFKIDGLAQRRRPVAQHTFNDAGLIAQAVLDGLGIAQLPAYQVCGLLVERKLIRCLAQYAPADSGHYLCYLNRRPVPARIRAFVDYVTARMHAFDL